MQILEYGHSSPIAKLILLHFLFVVNSVTMASNSTRSVICSIICSISLHYILLYLQSISKDFYNGQLHSKEVTLEFILNSWLWTDFCQYLLKSTKAIFFTRGGVQFIWRWVHILCNDFIDLWMCKIFYWGTNVFALRAFDTLNLDVRSF